MSTASNSPPEGYFNDLSRPTGNDGHEKRNPSPPWEGNGAQDSANAGDSTVPKPKRIACVICRKRKLKCDGSKPSCSTCTRLGHNCAYDEVRRKSGPKRGYVKALEERLKQVETLLKTQDSPVTAPEGVSTNFATAPSNVNSAGLQSIVTSEFQHSTSGVLNGLHTEAWRFNKDSPQQPMDDLAFTTDMTMGMGLDDSTITWEMIGLGLEEPLPPQDTIDDLHQIYFDKIHCSLPMIHKFRYLAAMNLAPNQRPPVALRYAIWTLAASSVDKYSDLTDHFYRRSRKYIEIDYMKGHGEHMISIAHAQTHVLLASFEFKMMYFPRAWQSTGSAIRLCQMMSLHRLDGAGLDVKQCFPPPRDWTEGEERRRTFWMAFCEDRYASIGTGWPMTIDERDILTDLPASDEAFEMGRPEQTLSLSESMKPAGASKLSAFGGVVLMACLFGRNLVHLHRPDADGCDDDLNGDFWKRHRNMDNILLNTSLSMPPHLRLPNGLSNANIVFTNMNIHTSTICLHQAAIYKAEKHRLPSSISSESKVRCITAANEIAGIMRIISHVDLSSMNPFISFCLYVAARVFVQYLKSRPDDNQAGDSLRFLLSAMNVLKRKNPLTESFLIQLDVDLEGLGLHKQSYKAVFAYDKNNLGFESQFGKSFPKESGFRNECNSFLINPESQENSPIAPPDKSTSSRSEPMTAGTAAANNSFKVFNSERLDWLPLGDLDSCDVALSTSQLSSTAAYARPGGSTSSAYMNSGSSTGGEPGLSPDTGHSSSNRPTPNSTSPSETRPSLQVGQKSSTNNSYQTSPDILHGAQSSNKERRPSTSPFSAPLDPRSAGTTGLTPENTFNMPETPGREFVPPGWETNGQTTGFTPIGEGVFRQLYGLGPMDPMPMDLGWENHTES